MPNYDAHLHAFQVDLTEQSSRDRINLAKEHWRAYVQGRAESGLMRSKIAIEQAVLLSKWRAEDRARHSSRVRPAVCVDCGARHLEHFYTSRNVWYQTFKAGGYALCPTCFQSRVKRGVVQEADAHHR